MTHIAQNNKTMFDIRVVVIATFHFHSSCLQSWLEQDTSCPTCRLGLSVQSAANIHPDIERIIDEQENATRANNHFFHFNGTCRMQRFSIY